MLVHSWSLGFLRFLCSFAVASQPGVSASWRFLRPPFVIERFPGVRLVVLPRCAPLSSVSLHWRFFYAPSPRPLQSFFFLPSPFWKMTRSRPRSFPANVVKVFFPSWLRTFRSAGGVLVVGGTAPTFLGRFVVHNIGIRCNWILISQVYPFLVFLSRSTSSAFFDSYFAVVPPDLQILLCPAGLAFWKFFRTAR